jgi:hypothetical protein
MLKDDPRFQAIYQQVLKLWRTMDTGTQEEITTETQKLTALLQHAEPTNGA